MNTYRIQLPYLISHLSGEGELPYPHAMPRGVAFTINANSVDEASEMFAKELAEALGAKWEAVK